ncbi:AzlC family ABC transporter permease [Psychromarinibacter halotolerans]|uniref:AzlC family ABC transporter permease n=1 Tax=Psychromarinibacter halotolerans TaxID=1775175 RepID=A0ABV7GPA5_9RHOB|nr:AzlC family ABC transporter permease [Psychromarinibacter halotolerans]MDF0595439.1 AzlC family ABC transporter permease [Psychromarinibacter halotolerans]
MTLTVRSAYWRGFRAGLPFLVVLIPFAMVFGVVSIEAGLSVAQVLGFSALVIAGAAQITALQLMQDNVPTVMVLAAALAVNLRMAMYSAALVPYLGAAPMWQRAILAYFNVDQTFALAQVEYEKRPAMTVPERVAFFLGVATPVCPPWYLFTWIGAVVGARIPPEYGLDFAVPITFLAIIAPALRTPAHLAAALTSIVAALALAWMPSGIGVLLAAALAMVVGARVELWLKARSA